MCPPIPDNEEERLAALRRHALLDTPPEASFDRLTSLAARLFGVPLALVTLIDRDRQWFKSCGGAASGDLGLCETHRDISFCGHTILSDEPLVVEDACLDPRFADNPLVADGPNVRFYAGAPLRDGEGHALGTLCLLDFQPRVFPADLRAALAALAATVVSEIELRRSSAVLADSERLTRQMFSESPHPMWVFDCETLRFLAVNETALAHYGYSRSEFLAMTIADIRPPEELPRLRDARPGSGLRPGDKSLWRHRKKDGVLIWVEIAAHTIDYEGRAARVVVAADVTERRRAEDALRRSEQKLSLHFQQTPMACIEWSPDAEVIAWNPAAERIFGWSQSEVLGRRMLPLLVPDHAQPHVAEIAQALLTRKGGARSTNENRTKDGRTILCEWYNTPLINENGEVIGIAALAQDVTEQVRAEAALRESEEKYRLLAEGMEDVVSLHDAEGNLLYVSPSVYKLTGYTPEEALAVETLSEIHPDDRAKLRAGGGPQDGRSALFEVRRRCKDGRYVWVEVQGSPLADVQGGGGFVSVMRDITGRREAEESYRSLFENSVEGIYRTSPEGQILAVNAAAAHMLGHGSAEEARAFYTNLGQQLYVNPSRRAEFAAQLQQQGRVSDFEAEFRRKDGGVITVRLNARAIFGPGGAVRCYEGFMADITGRKALERDREALEAEREMLLIQTEALLADALENADHDPLTGLVNHRAFHKRLEEETEAAQRSGRPLALLLLDLDNFKGFNDAYGHLAGDDVLRQVAQALRPRCRAGNTLARFGGDEFALLMPGATAADAAQAADELRAAVARVGYRPPGYDTSIPLTLSVGAADAASDGSGRVALLEAADARLRVARSGGGDEGQAMRLRRSMTRSVEGFTMLDALVTAVDNKDRYTRKHSEDVMIYSVHIARVLGLDARTQHAVGVAALLHDVGKIGVPDAVLRKPGRLTDEEFAAVRQHPLMGAIIVGAVPGFEDALDAVRHHHERWDGEGYPFGLRGEETPLMARLMAVADAYSAMTTDRPLPQRHGPVPRPPPAPRRRRHPMGPRLRRRLPPGRGVGEASRPPIMGEAEAKRGVEVAVDATTSHGLKPEARKCPAPSRSASAVQGTQEKDSLRRMARLSLRPVDGGPFSASGFNPWRSPHPTTARKTIPTKTP